MQMWPASERQPTEHCLDFCLRMWFTVFRFLPQNIFKKIDQGPSSCLVCRLHCFWFLFYFFKIFYFTILFFLKRLALTLEANCNAAASQP